MNSTLDRPRRRQGRTRLGVGLAATGILALSSGVSLLATAGTAQAAEGKVWVCHATSSDSNPYLIQEVDASSANLEGHEAHRTSPTMTWQRDGVFEGVSHRAGEPKPDIIGEPGAPNAPAACGSGSGGGNGGGGNGGGGGNDRETEVVATVSFREPTCADGTVGWSGAATVDGQPAPAGLVTFSLTSGQAAPGQSVQVTATVTDNDYEFDNESRTQVVSHRFQPLPNDCVVTTELPAQPATTDPCGPANIAFALPNDTDRLDWTLLGSGDVSVAPQPGYAFPGQEQSRTFTLPADSAVACATETTPPASTPPASTPPVPTPPVVAPEVVPEVVPEVLGTESASPKPTKRPGGQPGSQPGQSGSQPGGDVDPVVLGAEAAAVPTAVNAGLGALPATAPDSLLGQLLTAGGAALMLAAGWLMTGRRQEGAHEA